MAGVSFYILAWLPVLFLAFCCVFAATLLQHFISWRNFLKL
jgi:hypothetical protein